MDGTSIPYQYNIHTPSVIRVLTSSSLFPPLRRRLPLLRHRTESSPLCDCDDDVVDDRCDSNDGDEAAKDDDGGGDDEVAAGRAGVCSLALLLHVRLQGSASFMGQRLCVMIEITILISIFYPKDRDLGTALDPRNIFTTVLSTSQIIFYFLI